MIPAIHTDVIQELVGNRSNLVRGRQFLLDNYIEEKKQHKKGIGRTPKAVPVEELKFELYLPLHELWKEYITELLGRNFNEKNIAQRIVKADLHGALISVWKSSCKSYEGQKGIVLQETMKSFRVITRDNKLKSKDYCSVLEAGLDIFN